MVRKAAEAGMSVSELVRDHLGAVSVVNRDDERTLVRQVARVGSNLNQLARWANTYKRSVEALTVLQALRSISADLSALRRDRAEEGREAAESSTPEVA